MLENKLKQYKHKYYLNAIIRGSIFAVSLVLSVFIFVNTVEFIGFLGRTARGVLFFSFVGATIAALYYWVIRPISQLIIVNRQISDIAAAQEIGTKFPEINDKLVNTLQLLKDKEGKSDLILASIEQRQQEFSTVDFQQAIQLKVNKRYLKYLAWPTFLLIAILLVEPGLFTESTPRLVNYTKEFEKEAPFRFNFPNNDLKVFRDDDFTLDVKLEGIAIPNEVYITTNKGQRLKMQAGQQGAFTYVLQKVQSDLNFKLEAAGFQSTQKTLKVLYRPGLRNFNAYLKYPKYIAKENQRVENTGNLSVPEGTEILWKFQAQYAQSLALNFEKTGKAAANASDQDNAFSYNKIATTSERYRILLENEHGPNKDVIEYFLTVVPDQYPTVSINQYQDTVLYEFLMIGGAIGDDYGISSLNLMVRKLNENGKSQTDFEPVKVAFNKNLVNQSFYHKLPLSSFALKDGQSLEYYVEVSDNDGYNGRKRSKTPIYQMRRPSRKDMKEEINRSTAQTEQEIDQTLQKAKQLNQELKQVQDRLKGKKRLEWQDKKNLEELLQQKEALEKELEKLRKSNELLNEKQQKFGAENEELQKKAEQLQKIMDEMLDDETKELWQELNKLLEENFVNKKLQDLLENLESDQKNVENDLDRALELFKKLKFDSKMNDIAKDLEELAEKQEELAEKTEETDQADEQQVNERKEEQQQLKESFEDIKKEMEELDSLNKEMKAKQDLDQLQDQERGIEQQQKDAQDALEQKEQKKASDAQKKAAEQMQQMAQQMQQMQQSMEMEQLQENYDDLRQILTNLTALSFDQERLMLDFRKIRRIDPKFVELSQEQLKIRDDAQVIEDSLMALSKRVFQIESFVTKELSSMNKYMEESLDAIKKRIPELASSKQQFTMTSVNNLALLLDDVLDQMQNQMSAAMSGKQMKEKPGGSPSMSQLQKQLNQQIEDLKKSGKSGKELSKELAKLAAQQEMIRNAMQKGMGGSQQLQQNNGEKGEGGQEQQNDQLTPGQYRKMLEDMEKTEEDIVNKRITEQTINRQKEILTRLLKSEKAAKERELEEERKAKTAEQNQIREVPRDFSEYLKLKEIQVELLKTIPPSLNEYYKKEVNEYFKNIKNN